MTGRGPGAGITRAGGSGRACGATAMRPARSGQVARNSAAEASEKQRRVARAAKPCQAARHSASGTSRPSGRRARWAGSPCPSGGRPR